MDFNYFFNQPPQFGYFAPPAYQMNYAQYYMAPPAPPPPMFPINGYFPAPTPFSMNHYAYPGHAFFNMDPGYGFHPMPPPPPYGFAPGFQQDFAGYYREFQWTPLPDRFGFDTPNPEDRPATEMTPLNPMTPTPFQPDEFPQAADEIDEEEEDEIIEIKLEPEVIFEGKFEPQPVNEEPVVEGQLLFKEEEQMRDIGFNILPRGVIFEVYSPLKCRDIDEHWEVPIDSREEELRANIASSAQAEPCAACLQRENQAAEKKRKAQAARKTRQATRKRKAPGARNVADEQTAPKKRGRPSKAELARREAANRISME